MLKREAHPEIDPGLPNIVEMRVMQHRPKNLERGIAEAILIEEVEEDDRYTSANRKSEWGRAPLRRLTVQSNID